jgi:RimJ/RimL family protein N-acetyltransferase
MARILNWQPARIPPRKVIRGDGVRLEPIAPRNHAAALYTATHGPDRDERLWDFMFVGPFATARDFGYWLSDCAESDDPLFYAIVDRKRGPLGVASYTRINANHGVIEIGNIFFAGALQHTREATEAIFLLLQHAFDHLGYRRVEWKCDARNRRSLHAAARFGFQREGLLRQHMVVKGESRDTVWFAMLNRDWPRIRRAYQRWLHDKNFDEDGRQRRALKVPSREY